MPKYRVMLRGENFRLRIDGELSTLGFFTTRHVEAADPEAAEHAAVALVRGDSWLQGAVANPRDDPPMIYLDALTELASFDDVDPPDTGFTFFPKEEGDG